MIEGIAPPGSADPRRLGPFRVHGVLGGGTLGPVYLGRGTPRPGLRKQTVAVRALRPELLRDRQLRARVRHETGTTARHPGLPCVARALACELDGDLPWLASEFAPGPTLGTVVREYGPLPEDAVRALGGALCGALAALHAAGLAHRDLRPGNVLLAADHPRLLDSGLRPGGAGPAEDDEAAGPADDMFELGVVLAHAASARLPFHGSVLPATRESPDLTGVPEGLHPALLACLHKEPGSRPAPGPLGRLLDLGDQGERPAAEWLPEHCRHEIDVHAARVRALLPRGLFRR
ncbi:protein kinase [Streptomyces sp. JJ36]|uniref:protein kinase domain-containing protein n=1 Tax=Streptomyces sp. JJ36 TaxID=2736645 RepID=UPI001F022E84|nr:protein kinase [Streptomyces sp. JJ36]MCF6524670.1 protein kinase [Streptomyces sp. JJ36]